MNTGVYKITNLVNGKCYVGSCSHKQGFKLRWGNHRRSLVKGKHHSIILQRAWDKYGKDSFQFKIVEECDPVKCIEREQYYLNTLHPEYNVRPIAGSCLGRKLSPEHIQKLKNRFYDWMKGDNNWNKSPEKREFYRQRMKTINLSSYLTEDSRRKISEFQKGRPKTESHKQNISESLKGIPKSKEQIEKMRKFMKNWAKENSSGDKNYFYGRRFTGEINPNFAGYFKFKNTITNEEIISSQTEFVKRFSFDSGKVSALCLGKRKSHHKWVCLGKE